MPDFFFVDKIQESQGFFLFPKNAIIIP